MTVAQLPVLPRYMQKANLILETIAEQPGKAWTRTQRELCETLGISQPELSNLVKLLIEHDKIMKGASIPGVRGKNNILIVKDPVPFEDVVHRNTPVLRMIHPQDRVAEPGETVTGISDLRQYDVKLIGEAVIHALKEAWTQQAEHITLRAEQNARLREYREQMQKDRQLRIQIADERDFLTDRVAELEKEKTVLRKELNEALVNSPRKEVHTYPLRDTLDEDSKRMLDQLMRTRPGLYKESDASLGLPPEDQD